MRKWLYDRPWIWIVVLLGFLVASGLVIVVIAELNRPEIVKDRKVVLTNSMSADEHLAATAGNAKEGVV